MADEADSERQTLPEGVLAQHRHLAALIQKLRHAHESGRSWDDLGRLLDELLADVADHFTSEEEAMERGAYPRLAEHRTQHRVFLRRIKALRLECDRRQTELMPVLTELLESWFRQHEATLDRHAIDFLGLEL